MPNNFDPYFEWLGIKGGGRTPDHYRLLGLKQFESDPELIARAADAALARVRRVRPGAQLAQWSRLLDHIGATKACLLDPRSRKAYDEGLSTPLSARPAPVEPAFGPPLMSDDLMAEFDAMEVQPVPITRPTPASFGMGPLMVGLVVLAIVAAGVFIYTMRPRPTLVVRQVLAQQAESGLGRSPAVRAAPATAPPRPPAPSPRPPPPQPPVETDSLPGTPGLLKFSPVETPKRDAERQPPAEKPQPPAAKPQPAADATTTDAFVRAVADTRTALANRDLAAAGEHVKRASAKVQTPENHDQIDRLETMLDHLTQFWNGIRASMAKLQAAEEIVVRDTRIVVIDSSRDRLTVKAEGRVHHFRIETMPASLVMALVEQNFGHDAGSKAVIATFLAVDPNGDRDLARQYWREAAGAGIDCQNLLIELDAMPPAVGRPGK